MSSKDTKVFSEVKAVGSIPSSARGRGEKNLSEARRERSRKESVDSPPKCGESRVVGIGDGKPGFGDDIQR